ncbi:MAG: tRNA (adenosine(37)-N6)-threonylcarbamoyltransferase complex dimerization subunit type 1 TsaB [Arenicellales bacterium]|jgi:tRNA threonylcarbamoyladenosine biosynthesis protein TsaB|nr:tRNA (adenosine(37)-N6)-threonylcarbamoyltransferase complex dimerization subunit type 1 TsaB [Arenicellales bacterium]|tara:strand:- start:917 stop:1615 length:699 start_codon:yes stop_codon:yes gene_type:complete
MSEARFSLSLTRVLAVDTATEACSAACLARGKLVQRDVLDPQGHSRLLLGMIEAVLAQAQLSRASLDAVAYDAGPGSFTGIRIGASVAQGLALGLDKPLLAVSSLMALAEGVSAQDSSCPRVLAAIDARMNQVYWGCLERDDKAPGGWRWHEPPRVSDPANVTEHLDGCIGVGSGWDRFAGVFTAKHPVPWQAGAFPLAGDVAVIAHRLLAQGATGGWHDAMPVYVRDDVTG